MSNAPFDRDAYAIELLKFLANGGQFDGDQMGPDHTLDQISVAAELIEMGYMTGYPIPDSRRPINIGGPGITAKGRGYLTKRLKPNQPEKIERASTSVTAERPSAPLTLSRHGQVAESLRVRLSELSERMTVDFGTDRLNGHLERIGAIKQNLDQLDPYDLASVPERAISNIAGSINELLELFEQSLIPAADLERQHAPDVNRPGPLQLNAHNLSKWEEKIESLQMNVFSATAPILLHQTRRRLERGAGQRVNLDVPSTDLPDSAAVWKYFPVRNFTRSALCSGIWMSSMEKLRQWSEKQRGIVDVNEGAIPPVLQEFADEFIQALILSDENMERIKTKYPFTAQAVAKVSDILDAMNQTERIVVSSWSLRKSESAAMWMHYADGARGLAIRTTIGKLKKASWRTPFHLSAVNGSDVTLYGLLMRSVSYLTFTSEDRLTSLEDCYVPFLKREEFNDERELRIIGFSTAPLAQHGLVLHCDLSDLIDEIVIGPKADEKEIKQLISDKLPLLQKIPIRRSVCAPKSNGGR